MQLIPSSESPLLKAIRHVGEARRIVALQRDIIDQLKEAGCSTTDAERTLRVLEASLKTLQDHERVMRNEAAGRTARSLMKATIVSRRPSEI